jgi:transcriptional repressor NrdR
MQVWRRRLCTTCGALFTTNERVDLTTSLVVRGSDGHMAPFNRDKLFVSILQAVGHREQPLEDANGLTATIIAALIRATREASVAAHDITATATAVLKNFDTAAMVQYQAYHK